MFKEVETKFTTPLLNFFARILNRDYRSYEKEAKRFDLVS